MTAGPVSAREAAGLNSAETIRTAQADGHSQTSC